MELPDISKVPKKVWIVAVGIAGGATAIKVWKGRQSSGDIQTATGVDANSTGDATYSPASATALNGQTDYPVTGTTPLISPVILGGDNNEDNGNSALQSIYLDGVTSLITSWENMVGPLMSTQQELLLNGGAGLAAVAGAGGTPSGSTPVVSAPAPAAPTATRIPTGATDPVIKTVTENRNRDNGKSGAARKVWCAAVKINVHKSGKRVAVSEKKIKNGKC